MESKKIHFNGSNISYNIYGGGDPVMLIHGFGEDSGIWNEQVKFLQNNFRIIVPDLPGSGKSELLQKENVSVDDYAEVIKIILAAEKTDRLIIIGHSMGGYITLAFAEKYQECLKAFGLFHSGAYADDEEKIAVRKKAIQFIEQNGSKSFLKTSIPGLFYDPEKSKRHIDLLTEKGNEFSPEALIQYYNAMIARPDRTATLKNFSKPVLFVIGEHDKAIPVAHSLQQSHLPSISHIHILRSSAHMGMKEEAEKANEILAQFLHLA